MAWPDQLEEKWPEMADTELSSLGWLWDFGFVFLTTLVPESLGALSG
jgi:hypothetical protein